MIKKYWQITIRDYNIMEQTGNINHLVTSFVPARLLKNRIKKEIDKASKILNKNKENEDNEEKFNLTWKLHSWSKINAIEANLLGVINILNLGSKIAIYSNFLNEKSKRRIKVTNDNLHIFIQNIEMFTGYKIVKYEDVDKVRRDLEFRKDKFNENFTRERKTGNVFLMSVVLGVFSYLNLPMNLDITLIEFAQIKEDAIKMMEKEKSKSWQK